MKGHIIACLAAYAVAAVHPGEWHAAAAGAPRETLANGSTTDVGSLFLSNYPSGCLYQGQPTAATYARGEQTLVCLQLGESIAVFTVTVDSFSSLQVAGSYSSSNSTGGRPQTLSVACGKASSDDPAYATGSKKVYSMNGDMGRVFLPTYTAIVQMVKGEVTAITFDEGCYFCDASSPECVVNGLQVPGGPPVDSNNQRGCYMPEAQCASTGTSTNPDANSCDLNIFVSWTGTDRDGSYMTSAGRRFSQFRRYGMQLPSMWDRIRIAATDAVNRIDVSPVNPNYT